MPMPVNIPESLKPSDELVNLVRQLNLMPLKKWSARDIRALHGFATLHTHFIQPPVDEAYSDRRCNVNYVMPKKPRTKREGKWTWAREVFEVRINKIRFAHIYEYTPQNAPGDTDRYYVWVNPLFYNSIPIGSTFTKTMGAAKNVVQHWAFDFWRLSERVMRSDE